ncbi:MAG: hypothetical protein AAFU70_09615, partial [Planctomycetota bacterium]
MRSLVLSAVIAGAASGAVCQAVGVGDVDFWASAEIETPTGASFTDEDTSSAPPVSGRLETVVRTEKTHSSEKVFWRYNASVTIEEDLDRGEFLVEAESVSRSHTGVGVSSRVGFSIEFNVPGPTRLGLADDAFLSVARGSGDPDGPVPVAASASLGLRTPGGATIPFMRASGVTPTKQRNLPPGTYVPPLIFVTLLSVVLVPTLVVGTLFGIRTAWIGREWISIAPLMPWALTWSLAAGTLGTVGGDLPERIAFHLSSDALDALVEEALALPEEVQYVDEEPRRVGLYLIDEIRRTGSTRV